jgi:peptidoglycan/LPS O-acetylase OafA/YrhL
MAEQSDRIRSLDGLRGLAAVVVMMGHIVDASVTGQAAASVGVTHIHGIGQALAYLLRHVIFAGMDWVIVFFVLSGFVLSLMATSGAGFDALRYYPSRFVRLYIPVWGALIVAAILHLVVSHDAVPGATDWLNQHSESLSLGRALDDVTLVFKAGDGAFSAVLWSLKWEVWFSILLPIYLLLGGRLRLKLGVPLSLLVIAVLGDNDAARYLPTFMLGVVLAFDHQRLRNLSPRLVWAILIVSLCGIPADRWLPHVIPQSLDLAITAASALGVMVCAMNPGVFRAALETRPAQVVGKRSFSLYLVHEPLVVALAFALGGKPSVILLTAVCLPLIALLTQAFYVSVERPAHRMARWSGRMVATKAATIRSSTA